MLTHLCDTSSKYTTVVVHYPYCEIPACTSQWLFLLADFKFLNPAESIIETCLVSHRTSNEYPKYAFLWRNKKNSNLYITFTGAFEN